MANGEAGGGDSVPAVPTAYLDEVLALVADALVTIDASGTITYASPALRQLIGYEPHTLVGQPARDYLDPEHAEAAMAAAARPGKSRDPGRLVRLRHATDGYREVVAFSRPSRREGIDVVSIVLRPVDDQRHTLDALRHRLAFEDLLTRVAATFIHRPAHEVNAAIEEVLETIGTFAAVDRAYVYVLPEGRDVVELLHEWTAPGVAPVRRVERLVPAASMPAWLGVLREGEPVYVAQVAQLSDRWALERAQLELLGVGASLAVPIADGDKLIGFVGFDIDGGERLWSDDQLAVLSATAGIISQALGRQEAEQRFGLAFDRAPLGMALHGPDGRHLQVNPAFAELVRRDPDDLIGTSVLDYIVEEDRDRLVREHRRLVEREIEQLILELRFVRPDGEIVWCRVHSAAVRSTDGTMRYTVSHVEDVTERNQRESALAASEERYRTLVENSPNIVVRFDRDFQVVYISRAIEDVIGGDLEQFGLSPTELFLAADQNGRWRREVARVFETGERLDGEWEVPFDGGSFWFQSRSVPEFDEKGDVEHVLVVSSDITALKRSEAELAHQALHDPLTGLANRALLLDHLERVLARRTDADPEPPALLFIDLDRFKLVNDSLGHRVGDELLVAVAERLAATVRPEDLIARLGGDEFVIVLERVPDASEPVRVAQRVNIALSAPLVIAGHEVVSTGSIGIAMPTTETADAEGLLRDADAAMYLAKANGRDRFEIFDTALRTQATEKLQMESALRRAVESGGLEVHYQPELDLDTGEIVGFEALVRWNHPTEGRLAAWAFIELAEETGIILDLGEWVLREACRQAGEWHRARPERPLTLRVNLSGRQFAQADLVDQVVGALQAASIEPSALCLEITETALMADPAAGLRVLNDLSELGVELAIDDFGTGYSSLAYLKRFPVDVLKIDRSFVDGLGEDPDDTAIATAIISLARSMGLRVVAEGVETRRQLDELRRLGCDHAQGYLFAKPAAADEAWQVASPFPVNGAG